MRLSQPELRAARSLHRWLRRTAIAAIPILGLSCGDDCVEAPAVGMGTLPADAGWSVGSVHQAAECAPYCRIFDPCRTFSWSSCVVSADTRPFLECRGTQTRCGSGPCGRVPAGLRRQAWEPSFSAVATELAAAAHLEGAAVFAFEALERELIAHQAPPSLVARARSAQRDEQRHHSSMSRLARKYGGSVPEVRVERVPVRSLLEVAVENAAEGCVRETYGAAVAAYQGEWASDPGVRRVMRAIAVDEAEHASLGWSIDEWARSRLPAAQRKIVGLARERARADLRLHIQRPIALELISILGLPGPRASAALVSALDPLWD